MHRHTCSCGCSLHEYLHACILQDRGGRGHSLHLYDNFAVAVPAFLHTVRTSYTLGGKRVGRPGVQHNRDTPALHMGEQAGHYRAIFRETIDESMAGNPSIKERPCATSHDWKNKHLDRLPVAVYLRQGASKDGQGGRELQLAVVSSTQFRVQCVNLFGAIRCLSRAISSQPCNPSLHPATPPCHAPIRLPYDCINTINTPHQPCYLRATNFSVRARPLQRPPVPTICFRHNTCPPHHSLVTARI